MLVLIGAATTFTPRATNLLRHVVRSGGEPLQWALADMHERWARLKAILCANPSCSGITTAMHHRPTDDDEQQPCKQPCNVLAMF